MHCLSIFELILKSILLGAQMIKPPPINLEDKRLWADKTVEDKYAGIGKRGGTHTLNKKKYLRKIVVDLDGYGDV